MPDYGRGRQSGTQSTEGPTGGSAVAEADANEDFTPTKERPTTSSRDYDELRERLAAWLGRQLPDADPVLSELHVPETNGMSSETVLFDVELTEGGERTTKACVARIEPEATAVPVFPDYDLPKQFRVMRLVEERTEVPVPPTLWLEPDPDAVGAPFFVMEKVEGIVPPDVMPYPWGGDLGGSWVSNASREDQQRLQDSTVEVLAQLHELNPDNADLSFLEVDHPQPTAYGRHIAEWRAYYEWVAKDDRRSPLIERALDHLEATLPEHEGPPVLSWGDSRIGNVLYRDFTPVGVLDWEMAGVGPREVDLMWMVFIHWFFQDLGARMDLEGMPHFMRPDEVAAHYESLTGYTPRHLDHFVLYAAVRHAIVMTRVTQRSILFGEAERPEDPDDMIMHRASVEELLEGTYWDAR